MTATQCVIVDDVRPKIRESQFDDDMESRYKETLIEECSVPVADLIRKCWNSEASLRPDFNFILGVLWQETTYFSKCDTEVGVSADSFEVIVEE